MSGIESTERGAPVNHELSTDLLPADVLRPGDDGYAAASTTFFASGVPALVVRPDDVDGVVAAVRYATAEGLALSVRSGGHSMLGHGTNNGGMVLDLGRLDTVELVDSAAGIVRVGGGATWGQVASALAPHGLGLTAGDTAGVGVGGLTLGGGIGWMVRKHGLAIDNLVAARVVTAAGQVLAAGEAENPELFWAIRGGGGNFGVVVSFDFRAQPVRTVRFGTIISYRIEHLERLIQGWRDHMRGAPEALSSTLTLSPSLFGMPPSAMVTLCHADDDAGAAAEAIEPLLGIGTVTGNSVRERPYADILEDARHAPGIRIVARNVLLPSLDDAAIAAIVAAHGSGPATVLSLRSLGGAFGRVPAGATAFAHRDAEALVVGAAIVDEDATATGIEEALASWPGVASRGTGVYVNFQGSATEADLAAAYPPATIARLAEVKRALDPENVFALNHNIVPGGTDRTEVAA
jgi:FAD/FMN-containing dehydrogenase